jgi:hypothetical protein
MRFFGTIKAILIYENYTLSEKSGNGAKYDLNL